MEIHVSLIKIKKKVHWCLTMRLHSCLCIRASSVFYSSSRWRCSNHEEMLIPTCSADWLDSNAEVCYSFIMWRMWKSALLQSFLSDCLVFACSVFKLIKANAKHFKVWVHSCLVVQSSQTTWTWKWNGQTLGSVFERQDDFCTTRNST